MSKNIKKKIAPNAEKVELEIVVEPEALNSITSTYDSIQRSARDLVAALVASLPTSNYISQIEEIMRGYSKTWADYLLQITDTQVSSFSQLEAGILGLYKEVNNTARVTDVLVPQFIKELPPTTPQIQREIIVDNAKEMKKEIVSLRAELERLRREKEQNQKGNQKMAWKTKYIMTYGDNSFIKNKDFLGSAEYGEMVQLWNKLNADDDFDLGLAVILENAEASRLWGLLAKAMNYKKEDANNDLQAIKNELNQIKQALKSKPNKKNAKLHQKPNTGTREKIRELAKIREDAISKNKPINGWVASCQIAEINSETARINAPNLRANWYIKTYHWREDLENW